MKKVLYLVSYFILCGLAGAGTGYANREATSKKSKIFGFILVGITCIATFITGLAVGDAVIMIDDEKELEKEELCS